MFLLVGVIKNFAYLLVSKEFFRISSFNKVMYPLPIQIDFNFFTF